MTPACLPVSPRFSGRLTGCDAGFGVVSPRARIPDAPSGRRCCDAGFGPVSPTLYGQMPDAVMLASGWCLPLVFQSLRSDARCCDVLSLAFSFVSSQSLRSAARRCDAGSGVVSPASRVPGKSDSSLRLSLLAASWLFV